MTHALGLFLSRVLMAYPIIILELILKNHGLVTVGKTFDDAIQKATFFEQACHICLTNPEAKPLDITVVDRLRELGKA